MDGNEGSIPMAWRNVEDGTGYTEDRNQGTEKHIGGQQEGQINQRE